VNGYAGGRKRCTQAFNGEAVCRRSDERLRSIIWIILRLRKDGVDRTGSMLCLMVEYRTGHAERSVISATGDWHFSGCEVISSFLISE
jgi:hypothetical protein